MACLVYGMNGTKVIASMFILVLLVSTFVYAAGSSGGGSSSNSDNPPVVTAPQRINCEANTLREDRIRCRMDNKGRLMQNSSEIHESCRNLNATSKENCRRLYQETKECYGKNGTEKDRCFKLKTGFATSAVSGQGVNKEAARQYLVTLLYELEERVEEKEEAGVITAEKATEIIAKIVQIKEKILQGSPGSEIRPLIRELKQLWRVAFGSGNASSLNNTGTNSTSNSTTNST